MSMEDQTGDRSDGGRADGSDEVANGGGDGEPSGGDSSGDVTRRQLGGVACAVAAGGGLVGAYGTFFAFAGRYLYPARPPVRRWMYLARAVDLKPGDSIGYVTPRGEKVTVARQADAGGVDDFIALSGTCPHLGCQVHWEQPNNRFFCPCHNGVFDPGGDPVSGPPADAGQSLPRFALKLDDGLLFIEVEMDILNGATSSSAPAADGPVLADARTTNSGKDAQG